MSKQPWSSSSNESNTRSPFKLSILIPTSKLASQIKTVNDATKVTTLAVDEILHSLSHLALKNLETEHWDTYEVSQWMSDTADYYNGGIDPENSRDAALFENAIIAAYTELIDEIRTFMGTTNIAIPPWDKVEYQVNVLPRGTHVEIISRVSN